MPKTYFLIGSYYGGERLANLCATLRGTGHKDYALVVNEQRGTDRKPQGFAKTYNGLAELAARDKDCEFFWILGDDIHPSTDVMLSIEETMRQDPSIGAMAPSEAWKDRGIVVTVKHPKGEVVPIGEVLNDPDEDLIFTGFACACIRTDTWRKVGSMDESLGRGYCEDLDWGIRCWQAGYRCVAKRDFWFLHDRGGTFGQFIKDGLFGELESYEAGERAKLKWPWLWNGEPLEVTMARLYDWYNAERSKHA